MLPLDNPQTPILPTKPYKTRSTWPPTRPPDPFSFPPPQEVPPTASPKASPLLTKSIDADGAGDTMVNPALQLFIVNALKILFGRLGIPIANAQVRTGR